MSSRAGIAARRKAMAAKPLRLGIDVQPFYIPRCTNTACRAALADSDGNPRWDLLEGQFICLGRCLAVRPARAAGRP